MRVKRTIGGSKRDVVKYLNKQKIKKFLITKRNRMILGDFEIKAYPQYIPSHPIKYYLKSMESFDMR